MAKPHPGSKTGESQYEKLRTIQESIAAVNSRSNQRMPTKIYRPH